MRPMRVLMTGATGFVGARLARLLLAEGVEVHAVVRAKSDRSRIQAIENRIHVVVADLRDTQTIERQVAALRPTMVLHLAWFLAPGTYLSADQNLDMLCAGVGLARAAARAGCQRFLGAGTCLEYHLDADVVREDSPVRPTTLYGASKLALYTVLQQVSATTGMRVVWPRLFFLYGPCEGERRLVPTIIDSLAAARPPQLRSGDALRDFLHVDDAASAIWGVARSELDGAVNVGSGCAVAVRHVVKTIAELLGQRQVEPLWSGADGEPACICADVTLLRSATGWAPRYSLDEGLRHTIAWWRNRKPAMQEN